ncbi:RNA 2',3'-cyclic phosphodiesterase, partial [Candidatus Pacearchaeota archaeon CG10_big_fil_rev_8_21_14_0_10_35_13]
KAGEEFQVKEYCLIKSVLKPSGPEYKILEKYKLG